MVRRRKPLVGLVVLVLCAFVFAGQGYAQRGHYVLDEWTPGNTVVLANRVDARFCRDFSTLLKYLRLEWVILEEGTTLPDAVQGKDVILVGRLDATHTGEILRGLLTAQEMERLRATGEPVISEVESPWTEGRRAIIAAGADLISTRNAAEGAVRALIAGAPPADAWIRTRYDAPLDDRVYETVERLRYTWEDEELPLADLTIDVGAEPRRRVSADQAAKDVERLFYLFSHAYSGYAFFNQEGAFERAEAGILQELATRSSWPSEDLARLFYERLDFITDCHTRIGGYQYAAHADFWYDTDLELMLGQGGVEFTADGALYTLASIDGREPDAYLYPSLNAGGDPTYRLGTLSTDEPAPLRLVAVREGQEREFEVVLQRSDFAFYSDDLFREDTLGGIPVIRIRTFSDHHGEALNRFVDTARAHKGEPVLVVDVRGNGGGNEAWPVRWIQELTGRRAGSVFIYSELHSQTSLIGRANYVARLYHYYPKTTFYRQEAERYTRLAEGYEAGTYATNWEGPRYPSIPLIANDTTLILVMNEHVASSGEGLIMRASQAENVVVVGENSRGCLTFGNAAAFQLPNSRLMVYFPINFGLYPDLEFREGVGLAPDLWVPAADAVNYAVAAVRSGTITTEQRLPPELLAQPFAPEDPWARVRREILRRFAPIALLVVAGSVWAYFVRKRSRIVAAVGGLWLVAGSVALWMERPIGYGLLLLGAICLVWGGINVWRARRAPQGGPA